MKGAIFIALNEMIESQYGVDVWEALLEEVNPDCGGVYTSVENYPDEDVVKFVLAISKKLDVESSVVTRLFGRFLFDELNNKYPIFSELNPEFYRYIDSIENVIHKEVRKLFDEPSLPKLDTERSEKGMTLVYSSPRKLCFLAEGLIYGAADYFNKKIEIDHYQCMHDGHDCCHLRIIEHD